MDHRRGPFAVADVLAMAEDRRSRHELVDGTLIRSAPPGVRHQRASRRLANLLDDAARAAGAPVEVLEGINITVPSGLFIPDIAVVDAAASRDDQRDRDSLVALDAGAVLLVVEIVSPGSRHMDRRLKPMLYAEAGIAGFWRLDFAPAPSLMVADLKDGRYVERTTALAGGVTLIDVPFPVAVDPGTLADQ